jgi:hypothetical protein
MLRREASRLYGQSCNSIMLQLCPWTMWRREASRLYGQSYQDVEIIPWTMRRRVHRVSTDNHIMM